MNFELKLIPHSNHVQIYCSKSLPKPLHIFLRDAIEPSSRFWDGQLKSWMISYAVLRRVVCFARKQSSIDYSALAIEWQYMIAGACRAEDSGRPVIISKSDELRRAYETLHLLPSAPGSVVRIVFKTLALRAHPDRGGSTSQMAAINTAYDLICKSYKSVSNSG